MHNAAKAIAPLDLTVIMYFFSIKRKDFWDLLEVNVESHKSYAYQDKNQKYISNTEYFVCEFETRIHYPLL